MTIFMFLIIIYVYYAEIASALRETIPQKNVKL